MTERSESESAELGALADANASAEARLRDALANAITTLDQMCDGSNWPEFAQQGDGFRAYTHACEIVKTLADELFEEAAGTRPVPSVSCNNHSEQQRNTLGVTAGRDRQLTASAEARLREALENTNQLLIDVMHDQEADIRDRAFKQFDKNIDALSAHLHASAEARLREALEVSGDAIDEYYRYWTGGESRGSYDGRPERDNLWKAMHTVRAARKALSAHPHASDCDKQGER